MRSSVSKLELYIYLWISNLILYTVASDGLDLSHNPYAVLSHPGFLYSSLSPNSAIPALEFR
jgi:hypothetical protein